MSAETEAISDLIAWARGDGGVIEFDHPGDEPKAVRELTDAAAAELAALRERVKLLRGLVEEAATMKPYLTKPHEWDGFFERIATALEQP